jgi:transcriptional regulator with XRE-family HTH domain
MKRKNNAGGYERVKIGSNIRKWRSVKDIKQKDLAAALRMSEAAISNIENDLTDISLSQIEDISIKLDIEIAQLFSDPQEVIFQKPLLNNVEPSSSYVMEKDLVYALIGSIQKKDEQMKDVLSNVITTMDKLVRS